MISTVDNALKLTGHERDHEGMPESELDYMHARYCSPVLGRFLSVDPADSYVRVEPRSWNKYSYARNNPVRYVDPGGEAVLEVGDPIFAAYRKNSQMRQNFRSEMAERIPFIGSAVANVVDAVVLSQLFPENRRKFLENAIANADPSNFVAPLGPVASVQSRAGNQVIKRAAGAANPRGLGLEGVNLAGRSFNSGRKALERAGFVFEGTTNTGRQVFRNPSTGAQVFYDSGSALAPGQKPHRHVKDAAGNSYNRTGRSVGSDDVAGHIPASI